MAYNTTDRRPIVVVEAPAHPVQQLQGPFEESMFESQNGQVEEIDIPLDAATRRNALLEAPTYERIIAGRWRQKFGEKYHPLWKLVAQMSFGIHLLAEGMAKSEEDVFQILQTHVDDIDVFLERTTEDFTLAQDDIQERLKCLKLPLQHPDVFDRMLEDKTFRNSIVEGNEKIEHIVTRTGCNMKDALKDVQKGYDSTSSLERYLQDLELTWVRTTPEHEAVFVAMLGNVEGWKRAFLDLHTQGNKLASSLRKLTEVINQMQQRAGEVSRRLVRKQQRHGGSVNGLSSITYISQQDQPSRSASRQQATPSPLGSKKPLPAPTSRTSTRQQSRTDSRNDMYNSRSDTSQSQRSGTSQSHRTIDTRSETPGSRAQSRNELMNATANDDMQGTTRMNIGTPRMVYVKSHPGHHRANSQTASVRQYPAHPQPIIEEPRSATPPHNLHGQRDISRSKLQAIESNGISRVQTQPIETRVQSSTPIELPAELPSSAFLQAPMSKINRLSIGLGILPSERRAQAQSKAFNPTTALIELLNDPSRYSKLPVTPNSATSPGSALALLEGQQKLANHLQQAAMREPTPDQTPPKPGDTASTESTPSTPMWTSQIPDKTVRSKISAEMAPTHSYAPNQSSKDQSVRELHSTSKLPNPKIDTSVGTTKVGSTIGEPQSAAVSIERAPSELSAGYENEIPRLTVNKVAQQLTTLDHPAHRDLKKKKLSYIAELEGSLPIYLPSTVYTPTSSSTASVATHELEAPQTYFNLPPRNSAVGYGSNTLEINADNVEDAQATPVTQLSARDKTDEIQIQIEESNGESPAESEPAAQNTSTNGYTKEVDEEESASNEKTPRPVWTKRMSAKIETARDLVHLPSITPPGSPSRSRPFSTASRNSAMLDDRRVTTIYTAPAVETFIPSIPEDSVLNSNAINKEAISDSKPDEHPSEHFESLQSPVNLKSTAERPKSPFSLRVNTSHSQEQDKISVIGNSPVTPASIDLKRSNTKDSRSQWKAFFTGQLKSPNGSTKSVTSTPSVGQHSPKQSRTSATLVQVDSPIAEASTTETSPEPERDATLISFLSSPSPDDTDEDPIEKQSDGKGIVHRDDDDKEKDHDDVLGTTTTTTTYEHHDIFEDYA